MMQVHNHRGILREWSGDKELAVSVETTKKRLLEDTQVVMTKICNYTFLDMKTEMKSQKLFHIHVCTMHKHLF